MGVLQEGHQLLVLSLQVLLDPPWLPLRIASASLKVFSARLSEDAAAMFCPTMNDRQENQLEERLRKSRR